MKWLFVHIHGPQVIHCFIGPFGKFPNPPTPRKIPLNLGLGGVQSSRGLCPTPFLGGLGPFRPPIPSMSCGLYAAAHRPWHTFGLIRMRQKGAKGSFQHPPNHKLAHLSLFWPKTQGTQNGHILQDSIHGLFQLAEATSHLQ
ncbi:hypothetical protein O181_001619 [Austropuccinia psidii MF-1]|uniref:Uncharacterized protein n=1 Tax=Austropuccinia psidii MF-1 TaxID=1389203 RepID=A0A9Q3GC17_9BASI|nr:hypothetical protein [Austropuccinia psidii MF-1]